MISTEPAFAPRSRRRHLLSWASGMLVASFRYMTHRVPLYRRNRRLGCEEVPPDLERDLPGDAALVQRSASGIGPLYHRRYVIAFTDSRLSCNELIEKLRRNPNSATPTEISSFERLDTAEGTLLDVGDQLLVRLPGPWNGPVRVIEATDSSFALVTLRGHMESGQITFRASTTERGWIEFSIESWARCGDRLFDVLYNRLPIARELQLHMWSHFCEQVVKMAGGVVMTNVEVHTCKPGEAPAPDCD